VRTLLLTLICAFSLNGWAASEAEFFADFARLSPLQRGGEAEKICDEIFKTWPAQRYFERILDVGGAWNQNPDAAYLILSTCQGAWVNRYLDPVKTPQIRHQQDRSNVGEYISKMDLLGMSKYLREEIRLFLKVKPPADAAIPPSPYEVLTHLASSDRQLDVALHFETSQALKGAIQAGGLLAATAGVGKGFFNFARSRSVLASKVAKQALFIAIIAVGGAELSELGLWQARFNDLATQAESYRRALSDGRTIRALALEQYLKSVTLLGYFYTYKMYVKDGGHDAHPFAASEACDDRLRARFNGLEAAANPRFIFESKCRDAANLWLDASLYLRETFPGDEDARFIADKLMEKAKRAFWAFEETRAYLKSLKVCTPVIEQVIAPGLNPMQCRDPETGADFT
jgi:hypothetical protein